MCIYNIYIRLINLGSYMVFWVFISKITDFLKQYSNYISKILYQITIALGFLSTLNDLKNSHIFQPQIPKIFR